MPEKKKNESLVRSEKFSNLVILVLFWYRTSKTKSTSQARIKPEIFVNFRPEPDPKSPVRLTTVVVHIKDLVLSNYSKNSIFFKNLQKVAQRLGASLPHPRL